MPLSDDTSVADELGFSLCRVITGRRSAVEFSDRPIPHAVLSSIVQAGLSAPSSKNATPWRLHVLTDRAVIQEIAAAVEAAPGVEVFVPSDPSTGELRQWPSTVLESAGFLRDCQVAVFVENRGPFSNGRVSLAATRADRMADALIGYTFETLGVGAAIQNMQIAAGAFGVQSRFMGDIGVAEPYIRERLGLEVDLVGVVALGYSNVVLPPRAVAMDDATTVVWHGQTQTP